LSLGLLDSSVRGLTLRCSWPPGTRPPRWSPTMLPRRPSFVPVAAQEPRWAARCGHRVAPASPISVSIPLPGPLPEAHRGPDAGKPLPWRPIQQEV